MKPRSSAKSAALKFVLLVGVMSFVDAVGGETLLDRLRVTGDVGHPIYSRRLVGHPPRPERGDRRRQGPVPDGGLIIDGLELGEQPFHTVRVLRLRTSGACCAAAAA